MSSIANHPQAHPRVMGAVLSPFTAVFLKAFCAGMFTVVSPFEVARLGGGPTLMGSIGAVWIGSYVISLLATGGRVDRFNPRHLVRIGLAVMASMFLIMTQAERLWVFFAATSGFGLISGFFWPPIMGWISVGYEGRDLSRRLSRFNLSWSSGMVLGPLIGGILLDWVRLAPFVLAITCFVTAILVITLLRSPEGGTAPRPQAPPEGEPQHVQPELNDVFRPMARVAHFLSYVGNGIYRYQLPALAVTLGISAKGFGPVGMTLSLAMASSFVILGRTEWWHYRVSAFWGAQVVMALNMLALLFVQTWWHMCICMVVGGWTVGLVYSSDIFYGVSGGVRRARRMAIHELLLSSGIMTGAFTGGWVTEHVALRAIYPIGATAIMLGVALQLVFFLSRRARLAGPTE